MRRAAASVPFLVLLSMPAVAGAQDDSRGPFSLRGGKLIGNGEQAIAAGFGWPGVFFEWDTGISSDFGLGVRGDVLYGSPTSSSGSLLETHLGALVSAPMRLALSESRKVGIALGLRPGVYVGQFSGSRGARFGDDSTGLGFLVEGGILLTIAVSESLNVVCGGTVPVLVLVVLDADGTELFFPVVPFGGIELGLADDLNLSAVLEFGPALHVHEPEAELEATIRALFGIQYLL